MGDLSWIRSPDNLNIVTRDDQIAVKSRLCLSAGFGPFTPNYLVPSLNTFSSTFNRELDTLMAEAALYGNPSEPTFPYEAVSKHLTWIPSYIEARTDKRGRNLRHNELYATLINIILVYARARTSTFFGNQDVQIIRDFVKRLNKSLFLTSSEFSGALHHKVEIVMRGHGGVFVTCSRSPRFIWKQHPTHREVGLNLDYAAAGHVGCPGGSGTAFRVFEISRSAHSLILGEAVLLDYTSDFTRIQDFNARKIHLFNFVMQVLNLPYHFDGFWSTPSTETDISSVMQADIPPSLKWWNENYVFLSNMPFAMSFCSRETRYQDYWPLLKIMHEFVLTLNDTLDPLPCEYPAAVEDIFQHVYEYITIPKSIDLSETYSNVPDDSTSSIERADQNKILARINEISSNIPTLRQHTNQTSEGEIRRSDLQCYVYCIVEQITVYITSRRKCRQLTGSSHKVVAQWPETGNVRLPFDNPWVKRNYFQRWKDFFFPRKML